MVRRDELAEREGAAEEVCELQKDTQRCSSKFECREQGTIRSRRSNPLRRDPSNPLRNTACAGNKQRPPGTFEHSGVASLGLTNHWLRVREDVRYSDAAGGETQVQFSTRRGRAAAAAVCCVREAWKRIKPDGTIPQKIRRAAVHGKEAVEKQPVLTIRRFGGWQASPFC